MADLTLDDTRWGPDLPEGPCMVRLVWPPVPTEPAPNVFNVNIRVTDGKFSAAIDSVHQAGGVWVKDGAGKDWFLPWPPAAISIEPCP